MTEEQRREHARTMGEASGVARRQLAKSKPNAEIPPLALEDAIAVLTPALTAELETGEADWSARLAAVGVLVVNFPKHYRSTPEKMRELIERSLPVRVMQQEGMKERLTAGRVYTSLRAEWLRVPRWHSIRGLVHERFPREYVAPWEDYDEVCRNELPADIPPDEAPVIRFEDGTAALLRDGELPRALEPVTTGLKAIHGRPGKASERDRHGMP